MLEPTLLFSALVGGAIIGLSAAMLLVFNGRVAGVSGIFGGLLDRRPDWGWRLAYVTGLFVGGALLMAAHPGSLPTNLDTPVATLVVAGLLVGAGARVGNGCTSGHGVCGIGRLSRRSIVATVTFIASGAVAVYVTQHVLGGGL